MTGVCLFVCVVGPAFDSASTAFVRSRASRAAGSDGQLAQKTELGPHFWRKGLCRHNLCRCLQHSNLVQTVSSWNLSKGSSSSLVYSPFPIRLDFLFITFLLQEC